MFSDAFIDSLSAKSGTDTIPEIVPVMLTAFGAPNPSNWRSLMFTSSGGRKVPEITSVDEKPCPFSNEAAPALNEVLAGPVAPKGSGVSNSQIRAVSVPSPKNEMPL
jgi:hypothetical protein